MQEITRLKLSYKYFNHGEATEKEIMRETEKAIDKAVHLNSLKKGVRIK